MIRVSRQIGIISPYCTLVEIVPYQPRQSSAFASVMRGIAAARLFGWRGS